MPKYTCDAEGDKLYKDRQVVNISELTIPALEADFEKLAEPENTRKLINDFLGNFDRNGLVVFIDLAKKANTRLSGRQSIILALHTHLGHERFCTRYNVKAELELPNNIALTTTTTKTTTTPSSSSSSSSSSRKRLPPVALFSSSEGGNKREKLSTTTSSNVENVNTQAPTTSWNSTTQKKWFQLPPFPPYIPLSQAAFAGCHTPLFGPPLLPQGQQFWPVNLVSPVPPQTTTVPTNQMLQQPTNNNMLLPPSPDQTAWLLQMQQRNNQQFRLTTPQVRYNEGVREWQNQRKGNEQSESNSLINQRGGSNLGGKTL